MYFTVTNNTDAADTLLNVTTPLTPHAEIHEEMRDMTPAPTGSNVPAMATMHMEPVSAVPVNAHATVRFAPGGYHVMLIGPQQTLTRGDSVAVTLHFARAGDLPGRAAVITYSDVDTAVAH
jgi:copper(I)-binding protein